MKNNPDPAASAQSPETLLNDLHHLVAEAEKLMDRPLTEQTTEALGSLRERFEAAQARVGVLYEGARRRVVAGAKCTDQAIRDNPYQALAVAAGVGLVAGLLIGRRNR